MQVGLKERLIGAAVLVIVAAIVIPWVLKGNSTPGGAMVNKPLALPAATSSGPVQTYRLPLNSSAATAPGASALPTAGSAQPPAPVAQATDAAAGAKQGESPALAAQVNSPVPAPQAQPAAPAPVPRSPSPEAARSSNPAPAGKWVVQAGSYDSERAALAVEHKLVAHGYRAYVSRFHSKDRTYYRVRVGPYTSREEAARSVAGVSRAVGAKAAVMSNS